MVWIAKGTRLRAEWFGVKPVGLAGAQMKLGATVRTVVGTVVGVRGDAPRAEDCTEIYFEVQPDDGGETVMVKSPWVKEVFDGPDGASSPGGDQDPHPDG